MKLKGNEREKERESYREMEEAGWRALKVSEAEFITGLIDEGT